MEETNNGQNPLESYEGGNSKQERKVSNAGFPSKLKQHVKQMAAEQILPDHDEVISLILEKILKVDFGSRAGNIDDDKLKRKHYLIIAVEEILSKARQSGFGPGHYWVTVTSQNYEGCYDSAHYFLQDTSHLGFGWDIQKATCQGVFDGELEIELINTLSTTNNPIEPAYPYTISTYYNSAFDDSQIMLNSSSNKPLFDVTGGYYYVTGVDNEGCYVEDTIEIEAIYNPTYDSLNTENTSCNAACDGEMEFLVQDFSTSSYTMYYGGSSYLATSPNDLLQGLCPGFYSDTIVDGNGCWIPYEFTIEADELTMTADILSPQCASGNGYIDLTMSFAQAPFNYLWNTGATTDNITLTNPTGTYSVTATSISAPACVMADTFVIDTTDQMILELVPTHPSCDGINNGSITAVIANGASPYTYAWNNGQSTQTISGLGLGLYVVTVTDYNGCTVSNYVILSDLYYMSIDLDATNPTCIDANYQSIPGTIDLTITGGYPSYSTLWSNGASSEDLNMVYAGWYMVTVTDAVGCELVDSVEISQPTLLIDFDVLGQGCDSIQNTTSPTNGEITISITGGTLPYSYSWNNGATTDMISSLEDWDIYSVTVTDANGCVGIDTTVVLSEQTIELPQGWSIWSTYIEIPQSSTVADYFFNNGMFQYIVIMKNDIGNVYWPTFGIHLITNFDKSDGYQICMNSAQTLHVEGQLLCPEDNYILFDQTWNFIPYLKKESALIDTMLQNVIAPPFSQGTVEIVKSGNGSIFWPYWGLNTIVNMIPGEGYQVKVTTLNDGFYYTANSNHLGTKESNMKNGDFYSQLVDINNELNTGSSMVLGIPIECWDIEPNIGDIISVFGENGQLVGKTIYQGGFTGMLLYGDDITTFGVHEGLADGEMYTISIGNEDSKSTRVLKVSSWYQGDEYYAEDKVAVVGTKEATTNSEGNDLFKIEVYPNPANGEFNVKVFVQNEGQYTLNVYNVNGQSIYQSEQELAEGWQILQIDLSHVANGTYNLLIQNENINEHKKLLIIK